MLKFEWEVHQLKQFPYTENFSHTIYSLYTEFRSWDNCTDELQMCVSALEQKPFTQMKGKRIRQVV